MIVTPNRFKLSAGIKDLHELTPVRSMLIVSAPISAPDAAGATGDQHPQP
jgi:hypothetical protein